MKTKQELEYLKSDERYEMNFLCRDLILLGVRNVTIRKNSEITVTLENDEKMTGKASIQTLNAEFEDLTVSDMLNDVFEANIIQLNKN